MYKNEADFYINKLLDYYNLTNITDLATKINTLQQNISAWKSRNSINAIKKKCRELGIYNEIFKDINLEDSTLNNQQDKLSSLFQEAYKLSKETNTEEQLEQLLINYILRTKINKHFTKNEKRFWDFIIDKNKIEKEVAIELLIKKLQNIQIDSDNLSPKEIKKELINQISNINFFDKFQTGANDTVKNELISIVESLTNSEIYSLIENKDEVIEELKSIQPKFREINRKLSGY